MDCSVDQKSCVQGKMACTHDQESKLQCEFVAKLFKCKNRFLRVFVSIFQGVWAPKKIANPDYFEETYLFPMFTPISAIGLELWTMSKDIIFDNFIITNEMAAASSFSLEG